MAVAGSLTYDTKIDKNGFEKGLNSLTGSAKNAGTKIKSIITALGITKIISKAISTINSSIDGAVSRLDTLNNYPKVMSNLGIASEDAKKSIDKMSDKLAGLPTTLDAGALAVQRFTSKNSDVAKSTDYFLALNNALLAGGTSADIQSTALEQLSQAYAKGKPDMVEWRSIQTAMPAQLNQVAKAFNITSDKLGEALRSGKISMDDFMDKIVELNENGVEGFQSFEEQARNSTGGIATAIKVAKTQVVKGVTDIINALDKALKDEGLGGIAQFISKIGKKVKEVLDYISNYVPPVIKYIKTIVSEVIQKTKEGLDRINFKERMSSSKGLIKQVLERVTQLINYAIEKIPQIIVFLDKIAPIILGIIVAFKAFQVVTPIIESAKKAFALLNMVMSANPIGVVIGLVVALVGAIVLLYKNSEKFRDFVSNTFEYLKTKVQEIWTAIQPAIEKIKKALSDAWAKIQPKLEKLGDSFASLMEAFGPVGDWILNNIVPSFDSFADVLVWLIGVLADITSFIIDVSTKWNNILTEIIEFFMVKIPQAFEDLKNKLSEIGNNIKTFFENLWGSIISFFTETIPNALKNVKDVFVNYIEMAKEIFSNLPYYIGLVIGLIIGKIIEFKNKMVEFVTVTIPKWIENVKQWISELVYKIGYNIGEILGHIIQFGLNVWNWITIDLPQIIQGIIDWFKELPRKNMGMVIKYYRKY